MKKGLFTPSLLFRLSLLLLGLLGCENEEAKNKYKFSTELASLAVAGPPLYDFGSQWIDSESEATFTITNIGKITASELGGTFTYSAYEYKGGVFPGSGGSCGTSLSPNDSCTVVVTFRPVYVGTFNEYLRISYNNGAVLTNTTSPLINGRAIAGSAGALDFTLDADGKLIFSLGAGNASARAAAMAPDTSFYLGGTVDNGGETDFFVTHHQPSGAINKNFGTTGAVALDFGGANDQATALIRQPDGKILIAGRASISGTDRFALARLTALGTLDMGFGASGRATVAVGSGDSAIAAVAIQSSGAIVSVGSAKNGNAPAFGLSRHASNGALDTTFSGTGQMNLGFGGISDRGQAVAVQPDGKILVAGDSFNGTDQDGAVARLNSDGTLDTSFGINGKIFLDAGGGSQDRIFSMLVQPDGMILLGGSSGIGTQDFAMVRLTSSGTPDPNFGTNGRIVIPLSSGNDEIHHMLLADDGKIIASGFSSVGSDADFATVRVLFNGTLDSSFGTNGITFTSLGSTADVAWSSAFQGNGKILIAGETQNAGLANVAVIRLWP